MRYLPLTLVFLISFFSYGEPIKLQSYSKDTSLPHKLLIAALNNANLDYSHPYESDKDISNARILNDVKIGQLDVMWSMTSQSLEHDYQAIYIPLFRGLLGMRLAIVTQQNVEMFMHVSNIADLKKFRAGQGKTWPDTTILKENGLNVVTTLKYPNLFPMLEGGRFDYFPRGVNEPWDEIVNYRDLNLTVDPYVLLKYTAPLYFFVAKENTQLAQKLTQSLNDMIKDGSFNSMFFSDSQVQMVLQKANLKQRIIIPLSNPNLSSITPLSRTELWFNPLNESTTTQ
ncbi:MULTISPECIES: transporter substrate-binding domain-containing protein [unclassified Pseudoalteromonas]|uniref:transporter substrate-binding domain-containing protein n=1 Tax=unclassified Pseudoalteromonas TaxID=194690 RepID=UPI0025B446C8|nr:MULTISPECIES: transporter substrate-binding domain-containing protein [unclassified Pseudoalteromonas]MDN3377034.1 transporter substrate-binding domain-containing protein [Pseudoalteromonas sp. APC 3893]MDN3385797.1 transporter substrate-binding domain-containing protein [Pseudoalteromonas sp. APC 4017]